MQIVSNDVLLVDTMKNKIIGPSEVNEKFGVSPDRVIDVQALAGDSSDNVPGAPGIGVKTAAILINEFGNLEDLLENCGQIKQNKRRETIQNNKEQILISKKLVTLKDDVDDIPKVNELLKKEINFQKLVPFLVDLELNKLVDRIKKKNPSIDIKDTKSDLKKIEVNKKVPIEKIEHEHIQNENTKYHTILDLTELSKIVDKIFNVGFFIFDVETDSLNIQDANLVGISICFDVQNSFYIPIGHKEQTKQLTINEIKKELSPLFSSESIKKVGHNIKYDIAILKKYKIGVISIDDTMLMSLVCDAGMHRHNMDDLAKIHLNRDTIKFKDVVGSGKAQVTFDYVDIDNATNYAAEDAEITFKLYQILKRRMLHEKNGSVYFDIEKPLIECILNMENNGIKVDIQYLQELSLLFMDRIKNVEKKIYKLHNQISKLSLHNINPNEKIYS